MDTTSTSANTAPVEVLSAAVLPSALNPASTLYSRAWTCWAAATLASFAAIETVALVKAPREGTLSAHLRRRRAISAAAIAAFGAWATIHIGLQGREA